MTLGERLLRAAVWRAIDELDACRAAGVDTADAAAFKAACVDVVRVHRLAPWIEYAHLVERAERVAELCELLRSTYPQPVEAAA